MPGAARANMDMIKQDAPHCHAPIHPPAPTPTPAPHPGMPLMIVMGSFNVMTNYMPAARVGDMSMPCMMVPCVPGGPGNIAMGSATVMINNMPAARANDMTSHSACVAPIPAPVGKVMPPCSVNVNIGG